MTDYQIALKKLNDGSIEADLLDKMDIHLDNMLEIIAFHKSQQILSSSSTPQMVSHEQQQINNTSNNAHQETGKIFVLKKLNDGSIEADLLDKMDIHVDNMLEIIAFHNSQQILSSSPTPQMVSHQQQQINNTFNNAHQET
ncbi:unnamed protein product, partial [Rotaria sordida]